MTFISASAPGKAVLSGEYAVLREAPAISVAVNCRADVRVTTTGKDFHSIATPGHAEGQWRFTANDRGEVAWLDEPPIGGLALVEMAWLATAPREQRGLSITVDTRSFFAAGSGIKLGLGSSAAAMTALIGALCELAPGQHNRGALAMKAHKAFQRGQGSGVDIATSLHGGVIEFRMNNRDAPLQLRWPEGLFFRFLWSGQAADTGSKISKLGLTTGDEGNWDALLTAAQAVSSTWAGGNVTDILDEIRRYTKVLRRFSIDHNLGIFDAGHDGLVDLAAPSGVVYKPCGAGGGDIGIVMAIDESAVVRFGERAKESGFVSLDFALDQNGVEVSDGNCT